jgi:hypothetical protein
MPGFLLMAATMPSAGSLRSTNWLSFLPVQSAFAKRLAPRDQQTLAFSFDEREVGTDKKTGAPIRAPYIVWHPDPVDITATEALQAAAESKSPSARDNAKHFLEALLGNEPVGSRDVIEAAKENMIASRTLHRAKDELGIKVKKDGPIIDGERTWRWHLPTKDGKR